jgi:hypothetical protein
METSEEQEQERHMNTIGYRNPRFYQARPMPRLDSPNPAPPPQAAAPHPLAGQSADTGARLRTVIREIAATRKVNQISTRDVLLALITRQGEPWGGLWGREIARGNLRGPARKLAWLLQPFGIVPQTIWEPDGTTPKGYKMAQFDDDFPAGKPERPPWEHCDAITPEGA